MSRPLLLDVNLLIALTHAAHVHHALVQDWVQAQGQFAWSSCTITQLGFVRVTSTPAVGGDNTSPVAALSLLDQLLAHPGHHFWPDAEGIANSPALHSPLIVGHRQVTDAYLLGLAMHHGSALVTLDRGLASLAGALGAERHLHWIGPTAGSTAAHEPSVRYRAAATRRKR